MDCTVTYVIRSSLLELKSEGLYLKFDQPSEVTFKDISGTSTRMPVTKSCPSCKCVVSTRKVICPVAVAMFYVSISLRMSSTSESLCCQ